MSDPDIQATLALIRRTNRAETALHHILNAWNQLPHKGKVELDRRFPTLSEAITKATT